MPAHRAQSTRPEPRETSRDAARQPRARAVRRGRATRPATEPRRKGGVIRVLCVDDHAVLVEGLKARFSIDGGIEVAGRLATAARLVEEVERLRPDVVLLDIEMPG